MHIFILQFTIFFLEISVLFASIKCNHMGIEPLGYSCINDNNKHFLEKCHKKFLVAINPYIIVLWLIITF